MPSHAQLAGAASSRDHTSPTEGSRAIIVMISSRSVSDRPARAASRRKTEVSMPACIYGESVVWQEPSRPIFSFCSHRANRCIEERLRAFAADRDVLRRGHDPDGGFL